jgi:ATP-dependent helicase HrpA
VEDILLASLDSCILEGEDPLPAMAPRWRHWPSASAGLDRACRAPGRLTLEILKLWHGLQKRFKGKIDLARRWP